jgi:hypothetical protein
VSIQTIQTVERDIGGEGPNRPACSLSARRIGTYVKDSRSHHAYGLQGVTILW